jgi:hypothetical protein
MHALSLIENGQLSPKKKKIVLAHLRFSLHLLHSKITEYTLCLRFYREYFTGRMEEGRRRSKKGEE